MQRTSCGFLLRKIDVLVAPQRDGERKYTDYNRVNIWPLVIILTEKRPDNLKITLLNNVLLGILNLIIGQIVYQIV